MGRGVGTGMGAWADHRRPFEVGPGTNIAGTTRGTSSHLLMLECPCLQQVACSIPNLLVANNPPLHL